MKPANLKYKVINDSRGWVTNVDPTQQKEELSRVLRGFRQPRPGMIAERDWGTKQRFENYPSNTVYNIGSVANTSPIEVTITGHLFETDDYVDIKSVGGTTSANGLRQQITKTGANTFTINGSTGNANWTAGGTVQLSMDLVNGITLYIPTELKEYDLLFCVDGRGNSRMFLPTIGVDAVYYTITPSAGANGTITPSTATTVRQSGSLFFDIEAMPGYVVDEIVIDGSTTINGGTSKTSYTFDNIQADHTIAVTFTAGYTITSSVESGAGLITPLGALSYPVGGSVDYYVWAQPGWTILHVKVDGATVHSGGTSFSYSFTILAADHTITASFQGPPTP